MGSGPSARDSAWYREGFPDSFLLKVPLSGHRAQPARDARAQAAQPRAAWA
jgi:hypothetical protein